jgi:hypothetical protein
MADLYWHCLKCGDHTVVELTTPPYELGDHEPCECGGTAHVMTLRMGACFEQGIALGMSEREAWKRARTAQAAGDGGGG